MFFKIGAKNLAIFSGKYLRWILFLTKLQASNFPVNIEKFLRTFFIKHPLVAASEKSGFDLSFSSAVVKIYPSVVKFQKIVVNHESRPLNETLKIHKFPRKT